MQALLQRQTCSNAGECRGTVVIGYVLRKSCEKRQKGAPDFPKPASSLLRRVPSSQSLSLLGTAWRRELAKESGSRSSHCWTFPPNKSGSVRQFGECLNPSMQTAAWHGDYHTLPHGGVTRHVFDEVAHDYTGLLWDFRSVFCLSQVTGKGRLGYQGEDRLSSCLLLRWACGSDLIYLCPVTGAREGRGGLFNLPCLP